MWFEDFDLTKYRGQLSTFLSLMDKKEVTVFRKCQAKLIFVSNFRIADFYDMFLRRVSFFFCFAHIV